MTLYNVSRVIFLIPIQMRLLSTSIVWRLLLKTSLLGILTENIQKRIGLEICLITEKNEAQET